MNLHPSEAGALSTPHAAPAGRSCPLHYRYDTHQLNAPPADDWADLDVLYVVGGLYGNEPALEQIMRLYARESGRKRMVFNGDFHWFDADAAWFDRIQTQVLALGATRGNVETELAIGQTNSANGCGCAYPDWVDDGTVNRSNNILNQLHACITDAGRQQLAALPMWLRANVGGVKVGVVHGDAASLSGWGFARETLHDAAHRQQVQAWFDAADLDVFACTHTCTPVFAPFGGQGRARWLLNNGAAGMPNLQSDGSGLLTRIAKRPFDGPQRRYGAAIGSVHLEAIAIETDQQRWLAQFLRRWPSGSDAHLSYYDRITQGAQCALPTTIALEE